MSDNKLIKAYNDLMSHFYEAMDDTLHSVADALEIAKQKIHHQGDHSHEEVAQIGDYVMRDVEHAAGSANRSRDSLKEWLKFDIDLIENFALDAFWELADKTRIKLAALEMDAKQYHPYRSGDIASPGTFSCDNCGKHIAFKSTSAIPDCPVCQGKTYTRC
jgi:rubrerythrin